MCTPLAQLIQQRCRTTQRLESKPADPHRHSISARQQLQIHPRGLSVTVELGPITVFPLPTGTVSSSGELEEGVVLLESSVPSSQALVAPMARSPSVDSHLGLQPSERGLLMNSFLWLLEGRFPYSSTHVAQELLLCHAGSHDHDLSNQVKTSGWGLGSLPWVLHLSSKCRGHSLCIS